MNHQQNRSAALMDLPVEATVHLDLFSNQREVEHILRSHGFEFTDRDRSKVRIKGYFSRLKIVKRQLDQLKQSPPLPTAPSGNSYSSNKDKVTKSKSMLSVSRDRRVAPTSPEYLSLPHPDPGSTRMKQRPLHPDLDAAVSREQESFSIVEDVFIYANRLKKTDIEAIRTHHNVDLHPKREDDCYIVTVTGRESGPAASALKSLFSDLQQYLRTQGVPRKRTDRKALSLLQNIDRNEYVHESVLVLEMRDGLHLIGPSKESFELQQKLLKRSMFRRGIRWRSSLPAHKSTHMERQSAAAAAAAAAVYDDPSPGGAADYSSPMNGLGGGVKRKGAKPPTRSPFFFARSKNRSESPQKKVTPKKENDSSTSFMKKCKEFFGFSGSTKDSKKERGKFKEETENF